MMDLHGKKVLVVGLARTGLAMARFLRERGAVVSATEIKCRDEIEKEVIRDLDELSLSVEWGGHTVETFLTQDLVVVSPGVDLAIEPIQKAMKKGIPVLSEIELACRFIHVPIIAVTGTNGKTTTTLLIGEMLKEDGRRVGVGGNVGEPLVLFVDEKKGWEVLVVEISSFQLEAIETFRPRISVLLNITEDHLDRYRSYDDYIEAKSKIFIYQTPEDDAVLNGDDPIVMRLAESVKAKRVFFSLKEKANRTAFYDSPNIVLNLGLNLGLNPGLNLGEEETYSIAKAPLKGIHNVENMMAAITAVRLFGCSRRAVQDVLNRFEGIEHRLEFVREFRGVRYYNDSKGTNVGSVVKSLQSFSEPIVLIAGGKDKEGDLSPLRDLIRSRVKGMILIGEAKGRMARELGPLTKTATAETLEEAVLLAQGTAKEGEVVLLSPACSSYDMFRDYKERGKVFKEAVKRL